MNKNVFVFNKNNKVNEINIEFYKRRNKDFKFFVYSKIDEKITDQILKNNIVTEEDKEEIYIYSIVYNHGGVILNPNYRSNSNISVFLNCEELVNKEICVFQKKSKTIHRLIDNIIKNFKENKVSNSNFYIYDSINPYLEIGFEQNIPYKILKISNIVTNINIDEKWLNEETGKNFIENFYNSDVQNLYLNLNEYLKIELLKCCYLYIYGGIYLEKNYKIENNFSLVELTKNNKNCYCRNKNEWNSDFIVTKPGNMIFLELIKDIFASVKLNLLHYVDDAIIFHSDSNKIYVNDNIILSKCECNEEYVKEKYNINKTIPKIIWQTWSTKTLPVGMAKTVQKIKNNNSTFTHNLFDDDECKQFILKYFDNDMCDAFVNIIPGAYKADIWRYCVLYIHGGIYLDIKFEPVGDFNFNALLDNEHFCKDRDGEHWIKDGFGIYNAIMITYPRNKLLLLALKKIVYNYKNNIYEHGSLYLSGPGLLGNLYKKIYVDKKNIDMLNINSEYISYKNSNVLKCYNEYRNEQNCGTYKPYNEIWNKRKVYNLPVEFEYNVFLKYFSQFKFAEKNILKLDRHNYLDTCLDNFLSYFGNCDIYGYGDINFDKKNITCKKNISDLTSIFVEKKIYMDLVIDSGMIGKWEKNEKIMHSNIWDNFTTLYKYLNKNGIYIIYGFNNTNYSVDLYEKFFKILKNNLCGGSEDYCVEIIFFKNYLIIKKCP